MNRFEMVVLIIAIIAVAGIFKARFRHRLHPEENIRDDLENQRLREEVRDLKERIAVLERIATDRGTTLAHEIDQLRDR